MQQCSVVFGENHDLINDTCDCLLSGRMSEGGDIQHVMITCGMCLEVDRIVHNFSSPSNEYN